MSVLLGLILLSVYHHKCITIYLDGERAERLVAALSCLPSPPVRSCVVLLSVHHPNYIIYLRCITWRRFINCISLPAANVCGVVSWLSCTSSYTHRRISRGINPQRLATALSCLLLTWSDVALWPRPGGTSVSSALECPLEETRSIVSLDTSQMVSSPRSPGSLPSLALL